MHPQAEQESILGHFLLGGGDLEVGVVHLVVLDRHLRATTKKGRQLFWGKSAPPRQNPGYAYGRNICRGARITETAQRQRIVLIRLLFVDSVQRQAMVVQSRWQTVRRCGFVKYARLLFDWCLYSYQQLDTARVCDDRGFRPGRRWVLIRKN